MGYRAKTGFRTASRRHFSAGQLIRSDDPDVKQLLKLGLIETIDDFLSVEQATAEPGETRKVSPPKKKPAAKKKPKK